MSQPKDYDSTLARMAGNIAAGLVAMPSGGPVNSVVGYDNRITAISNLSVDLADAIIKLCREKFKSPALGEDRREGKTEKD